MRPRSHQTSRLLRLGLLAFLALVLGVRLPSGRGKGVRVDPRLITIEDDGHLFKKPESQRVWIEETIASFQRPLVETSPPSAAKPGH